MPNQWNQPPYVDDDDDDDEGKTQQQQVPKALRAHVTKLEKENAQLKETNKTLQVQVRETAISQVLTAKGIDVKVAKLVPSDIEPTPEAVDKWLTEYGELFVPKQGDKGSKQDPPGAEGQSNTADDLDEGELAELIQAMGRMNQVSNVAQPPGKAADLLAMLTDKSLTPEKLTALVHAAGGGIGSG